MGFEGFSSLVQQGALGGLVLSAADTSRKRSGRSKKRSVASLECVFIGCGDVLGAAEAKVVDGVAGFEAAAKAVAHECRKISTIFGALRSAAAEQLAIETRVAARVAGDHGRIEISNPFPDESVDIVNTEKVWCAQSDRGCLFRGWG